MMHPSLEVHWPVLGEEDLWVEVPLKNGRRFSGNLVENGGVHFGGALQLRRLDNKTIFILAEEIVSFAV